MARPCTKVTDNNYYNAKGYFERLLQKQQLFKDFNQHWEAKKALDALPSLDYKDTKATRSVAIEALQAWINQYATHKWSSFLALQRQRTFKKKNHMRTLELRMQAYLELKWYAEKMNLSLNDAVESLAKTALDKIKQIELKHEFAKYRNVTR